MREWIVQTGRYKNIVVARTTTQAVIVAFKDAPPENPSLLTRVKEYGGVWFYVDTVHFLKKAGYEVK